MGLIKADKLKTLVSEIYEGKPIVKALKEHEVTRYQFYEDLASEPQLSESYARAQLAKAEICAEEIIEIADTETDAQIARNKIDARKWYASKMRPDKYGDRIDVNVTNTVDIRAALSEAHNRIRDVIAIKPVQITASVDDLDDLLK